jgi:hypothetical protein
MFFSKRGKSGAGVQRLVDRLFYTSIGSIVVSGIFGLALALMFQRVCKDKRCIVVQTPPLKEIHDFVYEVGKNECYQYLPRIVKCA